MVSEASFLLQLEILLCIVFVAAFMLLNSYLPKWNIIYIHESGICLAIGLFSGFVVKEFIGELAEFDYHIFFNFMLPIIVLGAGFNVNKIRFMKNVRSIMLLGVIGSIISFFVIGLLTYTLSEHGFIFWRGSTVYISLQDSLLVGATLAATDVVCTLAFIKEHKTPRLHSILFGESVVNDAIAIVLLATLSKVEISTIDAPSILELIGEFLYICLSSIILGIIFGLLSAFITKEFTFLEKWPSRQTSIVLAILWLGYVFAEILEVSGVICILTSSIISGHYSYFNLSPDSRLVSKSCYHFLADGAEALVFVYLGLTSYSYDLFSVPPLFLVLMFCVMVAARFCGTYGLCYFIQLVTWGKYKLGFKNVALIWIGGVVRGGISFALALSFTGENSEILQITILTLVMGGTIVCGTLLPIWVKIVNVSDEAPRNIVNYEALEESPGWLVRTWRTFDDKFMMKYFVRPNYAPIEESEH